MFLQVPPALGRSRGLQSGGGSLAQIIGTVESKKLFITHQINRDHGLK